MLRCRQLRRGAQLVVLLAGLVAAAPGHAADHVVYDEALGLGWEDWSYFAAIVVDPANPAPVYSGAASLAVTFNDAWAALSLRVAPPLDAADFTAVRFWIYGAGATGTHLAVFAQESDGGAAGTVVSLTATSGVWTQVEIPLGDLGNPASIARLNFQDDGNEDVAATFFIDDLVLVGVVAGEVAIFADGFESGDTAAWCTELGCPVPPTVAPMVVTAGTSDVAGVTLPSRTLSWVDAAGDPREAVLVDQRPGGDGYPAGAGYLRRITYRAGGVDRVCTGLDNGVLHGFGYVTNHLGDPGDFGGSWGNWSPSVAGTTTVVLAGRHHAILEYAMPAYPLGGRTIPTTVQWFFASGRSHPLWSLSQDARAYPAGNLGGDSRSPYGEMAFAGDGDNGQRVAGVSWGDTKKFVTVSNGTWAESTLLASSSGWRYDQDNTIPYVLAWTENVDAEQGAVATSPISTQDQGSDPRVYPATGFAKGLVDLDGPLPAEDDWAYQLMNYPLPPAGGSTNKKMAWGTNSGAVGGFDNYGCGGCDLREFSRHRDSTTPFSGSRENGLVLAYSTLVVFGAHAGGYQDGATGQAVAQVENAQLATFAASLGSVRSEGPRGIGSAADVTVPYLPVGYNPIYATWDVDASGNAAAVSLTAAAGFPLANPILVVHGYTAATAPSAVLLNGVAAAADADYLATVDTAGDRLWITLVRTVSGTVQVAIQP